MCTVLVLGFFQHNPALALAQKVPVTANHGHRRLVLRETRLDQWSYGCLDLIHLATGEPIIMHIHKLQRVVAQRQIEDSNSTRHN